MRKRIKDIFNPCLIFTELGKMNVPWKNMWEDSLLNEMYLLHSGEKYPSLLANAYVTDTGVLSEFAQLHIAKMIYGKNSQFWNDVFEVLLVDYNPIHNYSMTESGKDVNSGSANVAYKDEIVGGYIKDGKSNQTSDLQSTVTLTKNGAEMRMTSDTNQVITKVGNATDIGDVVEESTKVSAYNDDTLHVSDGKITTTKPNHSETVGTTDSATDRLEFDGRTDTNIGSGNNVSENDYQESNEETRNTEGNNTTTSSSTVEHNFKREGNIGITQTQQMIEAELQLRTQNKLMDLLFTSVDKMLTLGIY